MSARSEAQPVILLVDASTMRAICTESTEAQFVAAVPARVDRLHQREYAEAAMATKPAAPSPVVLLLEPSDPDHHHAEMLTGAGFRVVSLPAHELTERAVKDVKPAIIAVELDGASSRDALDLAPRLHGAAPRGEPIPVIVYGHGLSAPDIERAVTGGAMWLQLEPADGAKLLAAIRGVLTAAGIARKKKRRTAARSR